MKNSYHSNLQNKIYEVFINVWNNLFHLKAYLTDYREAYHFLSSEPNELPFEEFEHTIFPFRLM